MSSVLLSITLCRELTDSNVVKMKLIKIIMMVSRVNFLVFMQTPLVVLMEKSGSYYKALEKVWQGKSSIVVFCCLCYYYYDAQDLQKVVLQIGKLRKQEIVETVKLRKQEKRGKEIL